MSDPAHWITSCLQTLVRELSEAERQSAQVRQAHLQKMDELRTQQEKQLLHLQQLWDRNMQELISGFSRDRLVRPYSAPLLVRTKCATLNTSLRVVQLNRGIVGNVTNTQLRHQEFLYHSGLQK